MRLAEPLFLTLLLLAPLLIWLGWPQRGPARRRQTSSLALRLIIFVLLVLSMARIEAVQANQNIAVVYLVDVSDSMPPEYQTLAATWVRDSLRTKAIDDQAAVILFGADALVERSMATVAELAPLTSIPTTLETDLEEAIRLALVLFPNGYGKRIVILSDGVETTGNAVRAAQLAAATGVEIQVVPFTYEPTDEALISDVRVPTVLREGEDFSLEVTVQATQPMAALLRVFAGNTVATEVAVDLVVGPQVFSIPLRTGTPGFTTFRVQLVPQVDTFLENNEMSAFSQVQGPPRVLVVAHSTPEVPNPAAGLTAALEIAGILYTLVGPGQLPSDLSVLAEFSSIVLVDVPATELSARQEVGIEQYVRDLGGGLVVVGGPNSFGVGGYYNTPLENVLPVNMQLRDEERRPNLTLVFIIDKSGSMTDMTGGVSRLDLAKEATIRSIELLSPLDRVGVIEFDSIARWVVPLTDMSNPGEIVARVGTIRPGGGTDILAGVQLAARDLPNDPGQIKHIILLTDGGASEAGIPQLVEQMFTQNGITFSTVGVGSDAAAFLPQLAQVGGGRYHLAIDPASVPEIFTEETLLATRSYIIEEEFFPLLASSSPIVSGITSVPSLYGYVGTSIKDAAQLILVSDLEDGNQDPILAAWQYGLGRSVAWTSDATTRWATNWVTWPEFPRLWAQIVRFTLNTTQNVDISANVTRDGELAQLTVDAIDADGNYINGLPLIANVITPAGETIQVEMVQVAPGQYQAAFQPDQQGAYLIRVAGSGADAETSLGQTTGWVLSYSPEYRVLEADPAALVRLAQITGGGSILNPSEAYSRTTGVQFNTQPLWPWLLLLAVLLLPFDIAIRRLVVSRRDIAQGVAWLRERLLPGSGKLPEARQKATNRLMQAKRRAGTGSPDDPSPQRPVKPTRSGAATINPSPPPPAAPPPAKPSAPPASGPATASTLLARKRRRQQDNENPD